jgi:hypothetical protein
MLNNSKFALELYGGYLSIKHLYLQGILLSQNPIGKRKHGVPMCFDVVTDLQGFMVQNSPNLHVLQNKFKGHAIMYIQRLEQSLNLQH